jgi:3-methyladenine DNA glycosylase AlkD
MPPNAAKKLPTKPARPSDGSISAEDVLARLRTLGNRRHRDGMSHFGIATDTALGIPVPALRKLSREIGQDHTLAMRLWASGVHEARALACMLASPSLMTGKQADAWVREIDSWDLCDGFAYDLMSHTRVRWQKPLVWAKSEHEFVRRAAFSLIAGLAVHDKEASDAHFIAMFPLIRAAARDDRNFVKKAVNWALRQIGKRNPELNRAAIACAEELRAVQSRTARWIASDALRELQSAAVQARLRSPKRAVSR